MLVSTPGFVLHTTHYGESSVIAKVFTRLLGARSYIIKGVRGNSARVKQNLLQPLSCLDMVVYDNPKTELNHVKEVSLRHPGQASDPVANALMDPFRSLPDCYPIYTKHVYSALHIPEVRAAAEQADRVAVAGVVAECCVLSTVFSLIDLGKDHRRVDLTSLEFGEGIDRLFCHRIVERADGQSNEGLIGVQPRIMVAELIDFQALDRFDDEG